MKIAVLIPTRGDRPLFLENCLRMINSQTLKPNHIEVVNDAPLNNECDITWRYRNGYDKLRNKGFDVILLMEDDDWYAPNYIETMVNKWVEKGKPDLLGHTHTIYYHIKLFSYFTMNHLTRSSAMNTLIKADLNFDWCVDHEPYTDLHLWKTLKGVLFTPEKNICLGIKHGVGLCGGRSHLDRLHRYDKHGTNDQNKEFLKSLMDEDSYNFYTNYFKEC